MAKLLFVMKIASIFANKKIAAALIITNSDTSFIRISLCDLLLFRIFPCQQFIQFVAANVTEILTFDEVENIFADVLDRKSVV